MALQFRDYHITLPSGDDHKVHLSDNDKGIIRFGGGIPHGSIITTENIKAMCGGCGGSDHCWFAEKDSR